jgi:cytochrome b
MTTNISETKITIWDLPTRLFHWLLVAFVIVSFITGKTGGNAMELHALSGYAILALLLFRTAWGLIGSEPSRFGTFLAGPAAVFRYAATLFRHDAPGYLTHNPLGGWSVVAMILSLSAQAMTGLFADDDIFTQGPLYGWVSRETSERLTSLHRLNSDLIVFLIALHVAAVLFHLIHKRENLIGEMITGTRAYAGPARPEIRPFRRAAAAAAIAGILVYFLVR